MVYILRHDKDLNRLNIKNTVETQLGSTHCAIKMTGSRGKMDASYQRTQYKFCMMPVNRELMWPFQHRL